MYVSRPPLLPQALDADPKNVEALGGYAVLLHASRRDDAKAEVGKRIVMKAIK